MSDAAALAQAHIPPPGRQAVVCDDDPMIVAVASLALRQGGFQVAGTAGSAAELMALLDLVEPDIMVLDRMLPDASGEQLLALVAARAPRCRVIVFSAAETEPPGCTVVAFARVPKRGTQDLVDAIARAAVDIDRGRQG